MYEVQKIQLYQVYATVILYNILNWYIYLSNLNTSSATENVGFHTICDVMHYACGPASSNHKEHRKTDTFSQNLENSGVGKLHFWLKGD